MSFLYFLEGIRNSFFTAFFSLITHIGEETFFLVLAILFFWCIDKRRGYYILLTGLFGTVINQVLKIICRIPRPWVKDPAFTPVDSAIEEATGYSFPSGHTQNAAGTFGTIARSSKRKWVAWVCAVIILLVSFSRMYLGVHTPLDVLVSLGIAMALTFGLYPMFSSEERMKRCMPYIIAAGYAASLAFLLYVCLMSTDGVDSANYESALKNACTLHGCILALIPVYIIDSRFIHFKTEAKWYAQLIKLAVGLGIVIGIKSGLSSLLVSLFGNAYIARCVRYFLIVVFAGAVWPLTFNFFSRLRIPPLDRLCERISARKARTQASDSE